MNPELALLLVPREGGNTTMIFMIEMVVIFAIFYFLLIRPQAKERKRHEEQVRALSKGTEVVTNGGIIGTVVHVDEDRLTLRTGENTKVTVSRARIAQILSAQGAKPEKDAKSSKGGKSGKADRGVES